MTSPQYAREGRGTVHSTVQMQWRKTLAPQADGHSQQWGIFGAARGPLTTKEQSVITVGQQGTGHCYQWLLRRANFPHVYALAGVIRSRPPATLELGLIRPSNRVRCAWHCSSD
jgi:hypothetical protein